MNIDELQRQSYETSKAHGFHDTDDLRDLLDAHYIEFAGPHSEEAFFEFVEPRWRHMQDSLRLLLAIGELVEAHEELRAGHHANVSRIENGKPEGVPSELADAVIRIADYAESRQIDLEGAIADKAAYNAGRPFMHGKVS